MVYLNLKNKRRKMLIWTRTICGYDADNMRTIFIRCHALVPTILSRLVSRNSRKFQGRYVADAREFHVRRICWNAPGDMHTYIYIHTYVRVSLVSISRALFAVSCAFVFNSTLKFSHFARRKIKIIFLIINWIAFSM